MLSQECSSCAGLFRDTSGTRGATERERCPGVDGPIDWNLIPNRPTRQDRSKVRIVYPTSRVEDELAELFLADIQRLLTIYAGQLEMFFWGYHPRELRGHPGVRFVVPIANYDCFFRKFAWFGFDVGLAPLRDDIFHRSKTDVKFREYAACGIAGVYSNVGAYARCVEDEVTGLLVSDRPGAWFDAVSRLLEDVELRQAIQEQARQYARKHYDLQVVEEVWYSQLQEVMANAIGGCHSFAVQANWRSASVPAQSHSGTQMTSRIPVAKQALACWARRLCRVIHTVRQSGFHRTLPDSPLSQQSDYPPAATNETPVLVNLAPNGFSQSGPSGIGSPSPLSPPRRGREVRVLAPAETPKGSEQPEPLEGREPPVPPGGARCWSTR